MTDHILDLTLLTEATLRSLYDRRMKEARKAQHKQDEDAWAKAVALGEVAHELKRRGVKP